VPGLLLNVSYGLGVPIPGWQLSVPLGVGLWQGDFDSITVKGRNFRSVSIYDVVIAGDGLLRFPMSKVTPFIGGGMGVHIVSVPLLSRLIAGSGSGASFGIHFFSGAQFPLEDQVDFLAQARYGIVFNMLGSGLSASVATICVGIVYRLPFTSILERVRSPAQQG
jgi:hypothetical protein